MISIKSITKQNWYKVIELDAGRHGRQYVSSNSYTILQAMFDNKLEYVKAIYYKKNPIGLIWFNPYGSHSMFINRFMIDEKYQGRGLGTEAFRISLKYFIKKYSPRKLTISSDNKIALRLYKKFGFIDKKNKFSKNFYRKYKEHYLELDFD